MGDLHDAVAALLDAFARGISVIRAQRARRKEQQQPVDTVQKTAETHLRKSLKKNRAEVKEAYGRDLARYGPRFASGDGKSAVQRGLDATVKHSLTFQQPKHNQRCLLSYSV
jgi:hypothetical protein